MSEPLELRPEVAAFAQAMQAYLDRHDQTRDQWRGQNLDDLLFQSCANRDNLLRTIEDIKRINRFGNCDSLTQITRTSLAGAALEQAAIVACAMMQAADICGGLGVTP